MKINFTNSLILRTPALTYQQNLTRENLSVFWRDPFIKESIYLASRSLYEELDSILKERSPANRRQTNSAFDTDLGIGYGFPIEPETIFTDQLPLMNSPLPAQTTYRFGF